MNKKSSAFFVAVFFILASLIGRAYAQTNAPAIKHPSLDGFVAKENPYNIDEKLYEIYRRADGTRSPECLKTADTLRREAIRLGDRKAECLADLAVLNYYCGKRSLDSMKVVGSKVCEFARDNDLLEYFYQAFNQQCVTLINCGKYQEAKSLIDDLRDESTENDFLFGLYCCYIQTALFFQIQSEYSSAVDYYLLAADFLEKNFPSYSPSRAYLQAAIACQNSFLFEDALIYAQEALDKSSELSILINTYDTVCSSLYVLKRYDEFEESFSKFKSAVQLYGSTDMDRYYASGLEHAIKGNTNRAISLLNQSRGGRIRAYLSRLVYERGGSYKEALALSDSTLNIVTNAYKLAVNLKSEEMMALLDNKRLQQENALLELANERARRMAIIVVFISTLIIVLLTSIYIIKRSRDHIHQLEQANAAKDKFVKLMSHEVRTPLNAIVGFSQMLIGEGENVSQEEKESFGEYINDSVNTLVSIFDGVLDALDLDSGAMSFDLKPASVNLICRSAIRSVGGRVPKNIRVSYFTKITDSFTIITDARRVQQILVNLMTNSFHATSEGCVELEASVEGDKCIFVLTDTGKGIPFDKAGMVFDRFYKIDEFQQGTGLGLSVSRDIAERLRGSLILDPSYTSGARFILTLPVN